MRGNSPNVPFWLDCWILGECVAISKCRPGKRRKQYVLSSSFWVYNKFGLQRVSWDRYNIRECGAKRHLVRTPCLYSVVIGVWHSSCFNNPYFPLPSARKLLRRPTGVIKHDTKRVGVFLVVSLSNSHALRNYCLCVAFFNCLDATVFFAVIRFNFHGPAYAYRMSHASNSFCKSRMAQVLICYLELITRCCESHSLGKVHTFEF